MVIDAHLCFHGCSLPLGRCCLSLPGRRLSFTAPHSTALGSTQPDRPPSESRATLVPLPASADGRAAALVPPPPERLLPLRAASAAALTMLVMLLLLLPLRLDCVGWAAAAGLAAMCVDAASGQALSGACLAAWRLRMGLPPALLMRLARLMRLLVRSRDAAMRHR